MRTFLLSFLAFATLFLFSSGAPLDKTIDEYTNILGLDYLRTDKKPFSKKVKPPNKIPGPKSFPEANDFGFFSRIPTNMISKIDALKQDDGQRRKKHLYGTRRHFAPLQEEPKRTSFLFQEDAAQGANTLTKNQNHMTLRKLEKIPSAAPVNVHQAEKWNE